MADEEKLGEGEGEAPPEPETKVTSSREIRDAVDAVVLALHGQDGIRQRIVEELAEEEIQKRVAMLRKALVKRADLYKKVNEVRPDQVSYDADGKKISESYSKAKVEERRKAREEVDKADKAIDKAVKEANYDLVKKLTGG